MYNAQGIHGLATEASGGRGMLDGTYLPEDGCLLLTSSDTRLRLRWTAELHEKFVDAVTQLGGPEKATPKTILRTMGVKGLTLYHLKSHLQKYRLGKQTNKEMMGKSKDASCVAKSQDTGPSSSVSLKTMSQDIINEYSTVTEALRAQMEVQQRLHEHLEVQRHLQIRIEAQSKYLQSILEKACSALDDQPAEAAREEELSQLEVEVANNCNCVLAIPSEKHMSSGVDNRSLLIVPARLDDCSIDSGLLLNGSSISPLKKRPYPVYNALESTPFDNNAKPVEWVLSNIG